MARSKLNLPPPKQRAWEDLPVEFKDWLYRLYARLGDGPFMLRVYNISELPDAADWGDFETFTSLVMVRDEHVEPMYVGDEGEDTGIVAYSDGTNWRRLNDNVIIV